MTILKFVEYDKTITKGIGYIPMPIVGTDQFTIKIRDIHLVNTLDIPIIVKIFQKSEEIVDQPVDIEFEPRIDIPANTRVSILLEQGMTLKPESGDTLFAYCDEPEGSFNSFVYFDKFLET